MRIPDIKKDDRHPDGSCSRLFHISLDLDLLTNGLTWFELCTQCLCLCACVCVFALSFMRMNQNEIHYFKMPVGKLFN